MRIRLLLLSVATVAISVPASAHLGLDAPPSRYGQNVLKTGPCGMGDGPRSANVTTFQAGETITIEWNEYVNHPGHYRVAFDADGQDDFADPACLANCDSRDMEIELYTNDSVLLDGIEDKQGGDYSVQVTLPNVVCDNCTLQVVQVMTDKPPYTVGGNDLYYQCADLILVDGDMPADMGGNTVDMGIDTPDTGTTPADMGGGNTNGSTNGGGTTSNPTADMGTTGEGTAVDKKGESGCATTGTGSAPVGSLLMLVLGMLSLRRRSGR